jgi:hypothetical protein
LAHYAFALVMTGTMRRSQLALQHMQNVPNSAVLFLDSTSNVERSGLPMTICSTRMLYGGQPLYVCLHNRETAVQHTDILSLVGVWKRFFPVTNR